MIWSERFPEAAGEIVHMLHEYDTRPAVEQLDTAYAHGGGWRDLPGVTLSDFTPPHLQGVKMHYPGDPPFACNAYTRIRDEYVMIFDHDLVVVTKDGKDLRCSRMD